jgi:hypothetical protein
MATTLKDHQAEPQQVRPILGTCCGLARARNKASCPGSAAGPCTSRVKPGQCVLALAAVHEEAREKLPPSTLVVPHTD